MHVAHNVGKRWRTGGGVSSEGPRRRTRYKSEHSLIIWKLIEAIDIFEIIPRYIKIGHSKEKR